MKNQELRSRNDMLMKIKSSRAGAMLMKRKCSGAGTVSFLRPEKKTHVTRPATNLHNGDARKSDRKVFY